LVVFFFFQAEDGIRDWRDWSSDVCSSDLPTTKRWQHTGGTIIGSRRHGTGMFISRAMKSEILGSQIMSHW